MMKPVSTHGLKSIIGNPQPRRRHMVPTSEEMFARYKQKLAGATSSTQKYGILNNARQCMKITNWQLSELERMAYEK
jgi:hypothetical protein